MPYLYRVCLQAQLTQDTFIYRVGLSHINISIYTAYTVVTKISRRKHIVFGGCGQLNPPEINEYFRCAYYCGLGFIK